MFHVRFRNKSTRCCARRKALPVNRNYGSERTRTSDRLVSQRQLRRSQSRPGRICHLSANHLPVRPPDGASRDVVADDMCDIYPTSRRRRQFVGVRQYSSASCRHAVPEQCASVADDGAIRTPPPAVCDTRWLPEWRRLRHAANR